MIHVSLVPRYMCTYNFWSGYRYAVHVCYVTRLHPTSWTMHVIWKLFSCVKAVKLSGLLITSRPTCTFRNVLNYQTRRNCLLQWRLPKRQFCSPEVDEHPALSESLAVVRKGKTPIAVSSDVHTLLVIQPDVKHGSEWPRVSPEHKLEEAVSLAESVSSWCVYDTRIDSLRRPNSKHLFGTGKVAELQEVIKKLPISAVFVNIAVLTPVQQTNLENMFNVDVFDRFSVVLRIFKEHAQTIQAKVQVQLAEIPYLRSRLSQSDKDGGHRNRGVSGKMAGGGESPLHLQQLELARREKKLLQKLEQIRTKRLVTRTQRSRTSVPLVAVVGYTNAGKTSLIRALTKDDSLQPEDMLFATLDTTVHAGRLPSGLKVLYMDTIGFISDLPHQLVDSFSSTLDDIKLAVRI